MDYEELYKKIPKESIKWNIQEVGKWLDFIEFSEFKGIFNQLKIDGSNILSLQDEDLEHELKIKSKIQRKKLLKWINEGLNEYDQFLQDKFSHQQIEHTQPHRKDDYDQLTNKKLLLQEKQQKYQYEKRNQKFYPSGEKSKVLENQDYFENNQEGVQSEVGFSNKGVKNIFDSEREWDYGKDDDELNGEDLNGVGSDQDNNTIQQERNLYDEVLNLIPYEGNQCKKQSIDYQGASIGRHSKNDVVILDESISRYHAKILFETKERNFYLQDIGSTTGTFLKIDQSIPIEEGMIFELGSNQFLVQTIQNDLKILELVVYEGTYINQTYQINFQENPTPKSIGRRNTNFIAMPDDHHMSGIHGQINYMGKQFYLEDMKSTNGTWVRLSIETEMSKPHLLFDQTIFKIGQSSQFKCELKKPFNEQKDSYNYQNSQLNSNIQYQQQDNYMQDSKIQSGISNKQNQQSECFICCTEDKDTVFLPCKHNFSCLACSKKLVKCPVCNQDIIDMIKIFK